MVVEEHEKPLVQVMIFRKLGPATLKYISPHPS
jgi:hypothetical protein